ncbi:class II fructose-bisphosphate aldolase [Feifania hominis]|uniref:Ketose-bisphosphate aldolase n=1 Tax=Feifania hominis TaxID=2763660 RepID=A0A926DE32_9FIRM|nr:ketose-bisphosphate aldolase [Feifania hominis]MBC8536413.1 ketose-bisphosphate aldolase [Feifania hominis]
MRLVNCSEMLCRAVAGHYAVPQFNINGLEWCKGVLEICQQLRSPVILGTAMPAVKAMGGYRTVRKLVGGLLEDLDITVAVALHLDHGDYEACQLCLRAGYSSVMFDGSRLPFSENLAMTRELVTQCREAGVSVEAEVGAIGAVKGGKAGMGECADPSQCREMAAAGITMLAAGIGNIHGVYPPDWPGLSWQLLAEIKEGVGELPLVLHGGSGIPVDMLQKAIGLGVGKININTECQIAFMQGARRYFETGRDREEKGYFVRNLTAVGVEAMKPVIREKIEQFGCAGAG